MRYGIQERWLEHIAAAFAREDLTPEQFEADIDAVLADLPPQHFLATVETKDPVYADSPVPYDWVTR